MDLLEAAVFGRGDVDGVGFGGSETDDGEDFDASGDGGFLGGGGVGKGGEEHCCKKTS